MIEKKEIAQLGRNLWSIPLNPVFDDVEKETINCILSNISEVKDVSLTLSPSADVWEFLFKLKKMCLIHDLDYGLDIRFFDLNDKIVVMEFIETFVEHLEF